MPARRRIDPDAGRAALREWQAAGGDAPRTVTATAVRWSLEEIAARAPGHTVEVRVPPFGVTQCIEGPRHTRGTPPNVVETDAATWLALVTGAITWAQARAEARVSASGERADLGGHLPLTP
ncbi:MAG: sterol carrier family protein [Angustibacter sp.]